MDALWYIDPDAGIDGVWDNSLAAEKPIYNEDFSQMTVKLREGIYWSDGVEFTADDLIYTVQVQKDTPGFAYTGQFCPLRREHGQAGQLYGCLQPDRAELALPRRLSPCAGTPAS